MQHTLESHTFLHNMEIIRIIIRKDIWLIIRGGKSTNTISRGNRDGSWEQIWDISGSFMWAGSIINGDGRYMQILANKFIFKGIIEEFINVPVAVIQC